MIRRAFTMRLKPGALAEYKYHHDNIWPELVAEIERSGIGSITTFQRDLDLFLVSEISDEGAWDKLWNSPVHQRWAEVMQPLMHLRDDGIVDSGELTEVFHLTTHGNRNGHAQHITVLTEPAATGPAARASAEPAGRALSGPRKNSLRRIKKRAAKAVKTKPAQKKSAKKMQRKVANKGRGKPAKAIKAVTKKATPKKRAKKRG